MTDRATERAVRILADATAAGDDVIDLHGLGLRTVPEAVFATPGVRALDLSGNRIRDLPDGIGDLTGLTRLDLAGNRLIALPAAVGRLTELRRLDVSENRLAGLPPEIAGCEELGNLDLYDNLLSDVDALAPMAGLVWLDLSHNRLTSVPKLSCADSLHRLDLSGNLLAELPPTVAHLHRLRVLDLSGNRLTAVTPLASLTLDELYLDGNELDQSAQVLGDRRTLTAATRAAIAEHTLGGHHPDRSYFDAGTYLFGFSVGISSLWAVRTVVDLYFKRFRAVGVTITLADGTRLALRNLSRKRALELVDRHTAGPARATIGFESNIASTAGADFVVAAVDRLLDAEIIPSQAGAPVIHLNLGGTTMGDHIHVGNVTNSNLNVKATLRNVRQTINASGADDATRAALSQLADRLDAALAELPAHQRSDGEAIAAATGDLIAQATQDNPNRKIVEIYADGLRRLTESVATVAPIVTEIVKIVTSLG